MKELLLTSVLALAMASCGHDSPHHSEGGAGVPGQGERPGMEYFSEAELSDPCPRFQGEGIELRYDLGGVLARQDADGTYSLTNLDTDRRVEFSHREIGVDSVTRIFLEIDGKMAPATRAKLVKEQGGTSFYKILYDNGGCALMVIEEDCPK